MTPAAKWDAVREFALTLPWAKEDYPWANVLVVKVERRDLPTPTWRHGLVNGPVFVWLGERDVDEPSMSVKLTQSYEAAIALTGAVPTRASGLGQFGRLTVNLAAADLELLLDWVAESYRDIAPKKLVKQLDVR